MNVNGEHYRTIWVSPDSAHEVQIIDQRRLPHRFVIETLCNADAAATAIRDMWVRGAGLIGATAGYGMALGALEAVTTRDFDAHMQGVAKTLIATRPTASNLEWAVKRVLTAMEKTESPTEKVDLAFREAGQIADDDAGWCRALGQHGLARIRKVATGKRDGEAVNILTHCNAGWLAFVDYGSATAPIYAAHDAGIPVHVWVDETRPRNQGASLTAWELAEHGVPYTLIPDNTGGHLMQHGMVDMVITGTDRVTRAGDVANKIGTYLKALAAHDTGIPFYVALPSSTFDWRIRDGLAEIPIEQRDGGEIRWLHGRTPEGTDSRILICREETPVANYGFDVTPARLVSALITERGICDANEAAILTLFPEHR